MFESIKNAIKSILTQKDKPVVILYEEAEQTAERPRKMHTGDAGFDVWATSVKWNKEFDCWEYSIGLKFNIPKGYYLQLTPRSSLFKTGLVMASSMGIIDRNFHGIVKAMFYEHSRTNRLHPYGKMERIGQLIIHPHTENVIFKKVDKLPTDPDDRKGGLGSTGRN